MFVLEDDLPREKFGPPIGIVETAALRMRSSLSEARDGVADFISGMADELGEDLVAPDERLTRFCVMESRDAFSIFVISGASDRPGMAAFPPRLIVVRRDGTGQEIIYRNQVGCAHFLSSLPVPEETSDPRPAVLDIDRRTLDVVGRHMSHLSHWDARPERLVALLETLADFLSKGALRGEDLFSDLCLPSLEAIGRSWAERLVETRILAGIEAAGLQAAVAALAERPVWEIEEIRSDLKRLVDWRIVEDAGASKTLHDRVVAVIHGTGEADLEI